MADNDQRSLNIQFTGQGEGSSSRSAARRDPAAITSCRDDKHSPRCASYTTGEPQFDWLTEGPEIDSHMNSSRCVYVSFWKKKELVHCLKFYKTPIDASNMSITGSYEYPEDRLDIPPEISYQVVRVKSRENLERYIPP